MALEALSNRNATEPIRKALNGPKVWPVFVSRREFLYKDSEYLFTIVDPARHHGRTIPVPSQFCSHLHHYFHFSVMGAVGSKVLVTALRDTVFPASKNESELQLMQGVYSFDALSMKWDASLYASLPTTVSPCLHQTSASAIDMDRGYLYVAGGYDQHGDEYIQGAERLNIRMKTWDAMPDPHVKRIAAAGVVMEGLFYVIGGYSLEKPNADSTDVRTNSGETWDPATRKWSLLPELWPEDVFGNKAEKRVVALGDRLYALRRVVQSDELMYYESASKAWKSLGLVPLDVIKDRYTCDSNNVDLLKVGEEIWVIHWKAWVCVATKPTLSHPLCWRTLPHTFKRAFEQGLSHRWIGELHV